MAQSRTKNLEVSVIRDTFKFDEESRTFECYGNVKNIIDLDSDRTKDGCFTDSIAYHKMKGTRPLMLWMHKRDSLPVGVWLEFIEDDKGLLLKGRLSDTITGKDLYILAKDGAIDKFSIGMAVISEAWNSNDGCNDIYKAHIKEVSWVNFAANDASEIQSIKSALDDNQMPTRRDLQNLLRSNGLSKRQAEKIANEYNPSAKGDIFDIIAKSY